MLDRVFGPGNSSVQVTAVLDFDKVVRETTTYGRSRNAPIASDCAAVSPSPATSTAGS